MEEKDIIEVEVEEEVISSDVENATFTDEEIDHKVEELKELLRKQNYTASIQSDALAKEIAVNSKEYLDNDTYLWTMYAYILRYRGMNTSDAENAECFCFLRMKQVLDSESKKKIRPQALTFVRNTLDENIKKEVAENTKFLKEVYRKLFVQFMGLLGAMVFLVVVFLYFVFRYSWTGILFYAVLMVLLGYMFTYRTLKQKFLSEQINATMAYCPDEELLEFDLPVRNS